LTMQDFYSFLPVAKVDLNFLHFIYDGLKKYTVPEVRIYSMVMAAFVHFNKMEYSLRVYKEMLQNNVYDELAFSSLISKLAGSKYWYEGKNILLDMESRQIEPMVHSYDLVLRDILQFS